MNQPHENHPGHVFDPTCEDKITVTAHPTGESMNGYACGRTGGHCLPDNCPKVKYGAKRKIKILTISD